jgi:hypothetical protein
MTLGPSYSLRSGKTPDPRGFSWRKKSVEYSPSGPYSQLRLRLHQWALLLSEVDANLGWFEGVKGSIAPERTDGHIVKWMSSWCLCFSFLCLSPDCAPERGVTSGPGGWRSSRAPLSNWLQGRARVEQEPLTRYCILPLPICYLSISLLWCFSSFMFLSFVHFSNFPLLYKPSSLVPHIFPLFIL